ncbi:MAG: group II intron reverse transcriptase/maturase [Solirubrobacteraceae bacterium]
MPASRDKPFAIPKPMVWEAWRQVKANKGAPGVDGQALEEFEADLRGNLYKIWNRMSSGSYFPPPVRAVEIPKAHCDGVRVLGVPTVADRIAQTVVAMYLGPLVEPRFHRDSYGYRPNKSALDAVGTCRARCWKFDWIIDLDVQRFFDTVPWDLVVEAVEAVTDCRWVLLYVKRWLAAPLQRPTHRVVHCKSRRQAEDVLGAIAARMQEVGLRLHPDKTRIVYCKDSNRRGAHEHTSFTFLGFAFRPREARGKDGGSFTGFLPAISPEALKAKSARLRDLRIHRRTNLSLDDLARWLNPIVAGWMNYYGRYYRTAMDPLLQRVNTYLMRWAGNKYRRQLRAHRRFRRWWTGLLDRQPGLFAHWTWVRGYV